MTNEQTFRGAAERLYSSKTEARDALRLALAALEISAPTWVAHMPAAERQHAAALAAVREWLDAHA